jgi:NAD+ kinase
MLKIALFRNLTDHDLSKYLLSLQKYQTSCTFDNRLKFDILLFMLEPPNATISRLSDVKANEIDLIITLGTSNAVLSALAYFQIKECPPFLTFSSEGVSFQSVFSLEEFEPVILRYLPLIAEKQELKYDVRSRIQGTINSNHTFHALNEFVISRGQNPHILRLELFVENVFLTESIGDGLIISTPTGSTAYSLSAGGPIILGNVNSTQIIPICPLSLSFRPLLLPSDALITIRLSPSTRGEAVVNADGLKNTKFTKDDTFTLKKSEFDVKGIKEIPFRLYK